MVAKDPSTDSFALAKSALEVTSFVFSSAEQVTVEATDVIFVVRVAMQLLLVLAVGFVASQDTYKCPDGWMLEEDRTGCRCFLIGPDEAVTRSTADLVCAGHSGSWAPSW